MARMMCKRAYPGLPPGAALAAVEVPAFDDWRGSGPSTPAGAHAGAQAAGEAGGWYESSRELSAGLGFSEGPWSEADFGPSAQQP